MYKSALIIDDDPISILVCETMLRKINFVEEIVSFKSGEDGISHMRKVLEQKGALPDFIFLDVQMPIMDGWEFLEIYGSLLHSPSINAHVVMLSATSNPDDRVRAGGYPLVLKFLDKPISSEALENLKPGT